MNRVTKNLVGLGFWLGISAVALITTGFVVMANYLACKTAFELLGFEMRPLKSDEIMGSLFDAFLPDATLAHFYALALTATLAMGFFLLFHIGAQIYDLSQDRATYIASGDRQSAEIALKLMLANAAWLFLFASVVAVASAWDLQLFRYRSVAGAMGIDDPLKAAGTIKGWDHQLRENGHLFAWSAARWGAFGYLGATILACLSMEFAFRKTADTWAKLLSSVEQLFKVRDDEVEASDAGEEIGGEADEGETLGSDEGVPPATGELFDAPPEGADPAYVNPPPDDGAVPEPAPRRRGIPWRNARTSVGEPQPAAVPPVGARPQPVNPDMREVVGEDDERITLAQARTNRERYHIDTDGQIWRREYWEQLHGLADHVETEAA